MSGTSLDGLDIVCCEFEWEDNKIKAYNILNAETIEFPEALRTRLSSCMELSGMELTSLDKDFGSWMGEQCLSFIKKHNISPDYIASHGHTVFHQPENRMTLQIGNGHYIYAKVNIPVVYDFRSLDVALDGQGAPLVPIGDKMLFDQFDICLNLGGFANISFEQVPDRKAYDICAANIVLNNLAQRLDKTFDSDGQIARSGQSIPRLFHMLSELSYYNESYPKSLGKEWVDNEIFPLLGMFKNEEPEDIVHTYTVHIASQISFELNRLRDSLKKKKVYEILATGGGVYNTFLIEQLTKNLDSDIKLTIPDRMLIDFKEALIFSLMGLLRLKGAVNCLCSVTGAIKDSSSGVIIGSNVLS